MQTPLQTVPVQALRNARFVERIAHGLNRTSFIIAASKHLLMARVRGSSDFGRFDRSLGRAAMATVRPQNYETRTRNETYA
jgi:hypothetical protein